MDEEHVFVLLLLSFEFLRHKRKNFTVTVVEQLFFFKLIF